MRCRSSAGPSGPDCRRMSLRSVLSPRRTCHVFTISTTCPAARAARIALFACFQAGDPRASSSRHSWRSPCGTHGSRGHITVRGQSSTFPRAEANSVWSVADDISWRIVVAHPDLSTPIGGDGAAHCPCRAPHDLRVMAADAGAGIAANIVSPRFLWPSSRPPGPETQCRRIWCRCSPRIGCLGDG